MINMCTNSNPSLFDSTEKTGAFGAIRIHDLIVKLEKMSPEEYKNKGENFTINYSYRKSPFGRILVASTQKGVCYIGFSDNDQLAYTELKNYFPKAKFIDQFDYFQKNALEVYNQDWSKDFKIKLHLKGTEFQFNVCQVLLKNPMGNLSKYGEVAKKSGKPKAARAVGTAIGSNPVAFLIPCHRVIQSSGKLGGYRWGENRKANIINWEIDKIKLYNTNN